MIHSLARRACNEKRQSLVGSHQRSWWFRTSMRGLRPTKLGHATTAIVDRKVGRPLNSYNTTFSTGQPRPPKTLLETQTFTDLSFRALFRCVHPAAAPFFELPSLCLSNEGDPMGPQTAIRGLPRFHLQARRPHHHLTRLWYNNRLNIEAENGP